MVELMTRIVACLLLAAAIGFAMAWLLRGLSVRARMQALDQALAEQQAHAAVALAAGSQAQVLRAQVAALENQAQSRTEALQAAQLVAREAQAEAEASAAMAASAAAMAQRDAEGHRRMLAERDAMVEQTRTRHAAAERAARDAEMRLVEAGQIADAQRVAAHAAQEASRQAAAALQAERALRTQAIEAAAVAQRAQAAEIAAATQRVQAAEIAAAAQRSLADAQLDAHAQRDDVQTDEDRAAALAMATLRERLSAAEGAALRGEQLTHDLQATRAELAGAQQRALQAEARAQQVERLSRQSAEQRDGELVRLNAELLQRSRDVDALAERIEGEQVSLAQREQAVAAQLKETATRAEAAQAEAIALRLRRDQQDARLALMAAFEAQAARYKATVAQRDATLLESKRNEQAATEAAARMREEVLTARKAVAETRAAHAAAEAQAADTLRRYETQVVALQRDLAQMAAASASMQADVQADVQADLQAHAHARMVAEQEIASLSAQLELADRLARGAEQAQAQLAELQAQRAQWLQQPAAAPVTRRPAKRSRRNAAAQAAAASPPEAAAPHDQVSVDAEQASHEMNPQAHRQPGAVQADDLSVAPSSADDAPDDLKRIYGIGPVLERLLNGLGITRFNQIAVWSAADVDRIDAQLANFRGRIRRDHWVAGARAEYLRKYGQDL